MWKVAVMAYELAYGVPPFDSKTLMRVAFTDEGITVRNPRMNAKTVEFREFIEGILKKDPK